MDGFEFDRLARAFAETLDRRRLMAAIGAVTGLLGPEAAGGAPLGPATCGEEGAVCTLVSRCCDGLTCVTSAINTSFGICVPGDGGMVSTGTTLISPFSETAVEEASALVETASTTSGPDPEAKRQARAAEIRARRETRRTERRTRSDNRRANVRNRKDKQRNRQRDARETDEAAPGPQLQLKMVFRKVDGDPDLEGVQLIPIEVVRVTNHDDRNVVLTRIETIRGATEGADLPTSQFALRPGESYSFVSGLPTEDATNDQYRWLDKVKCDEAVQGQGYRVRAAFSRGGENYDFVVRCDGPHTTGAVETRAAKPRRKENHTKNDEHKHKRKSQHQKKKR